MEQPAGGSPPRDAGAPARRALPELWEEDIQAELSGSGEILCIDKNTQVSFLIWQMTLSFPDWNVGITVDSHTGKLLSLSLRWLRGEPPSWGATGTVGFGSALAGLLGDGQCGCQLVYPTNQ